MNTELNEARFGANVIANNDDKTCFYTGLPRFALFLTLCDIVKPYFRSQKKAENSLFACLVKLRLNSPFKDLAYRFNLHLASVSESFHKCIDISYANLQQLIIWPDAELLKEKLPAVFRPYLQNARCIIDCFAVFIERQLSFQARAATYSNYKKHNTVKVFIAVAPTGSISFISKAWGGRVSDKVITQKCGFLDMIEGGDLVLADRGFNIAD